MNPQPSDLESAALPVGATGLHTNQPVLPGLLVDRVGLAEPAVLPELKTPGMSLLVLRRDIVALLALFACKRYEFRAALRHSKPSHPGQKPLHPSLTHPFAECQFSSSAPSGPHSMTLVTTPEATVLPPSRMANLSPSSIAMGSMSSALIFTLSPGITISTPSGSVTAPVTSVVLK